MGTIFHVPPLKFFTVDIIPGPTITSVNVERDGDSLTLTVNVSGNSDYEFALNDINGAVSG